MGTIQSVCPKSVAHLKRLNKTSRWILTSIVVSFGLLILALLAWNDLYDARVYARFAKENGYDVNHVKLFCKMHGYEAEDLVNKPSVQAELKDSINP